MIFTIQSIDSEKRKEEKLIRTSNTDSLIGCYNRRAYEKDMAALSLDTEFVYISMDVNGLKIVNDSLGHGAGDELLLGAAFCMKSSFSDHGKVYRTGGDEFICILFTDQESFGRIKETFDETVDQWSGKLVKALTVSCGAVSSREEQWSSLEEIVKVADMRMYEEKAIYYRKNGVDRRGQPEAYVALCRLYSRIVKADLTKDTCRILSWEGQPNVDKLEDKTQISPEDLEEYLEKTDIRYLRNSFDGGRQTVSVFYRRKTEENWEPVILEITPGEEYYRDNREVFLYMKVSDTVFGSPQAASLSE